jgi:hypothetical protein
MEKLAKSAPGARRRKPLGTRQGSAAEDEQGRKAAQLDARVRTTIVAADAPHGGAPWISATEAAQPDMVLVWSDLMAGAEPSLSRSAPATFAREDSPGNARRSPEEGGRQDGDVLTLKIRIGPSRVSEPVS